MEAKQPSESKTPAAMRPAVKVIGRYALHTEVATGGMATVYLGRLLGPVGFSRTVAIKRLHERFAKDPEFTTGFLDEARLAARIRHPNVVPTLDVVALGGELFLVMEYVQGESLAHLALAAHNSREAIPVGIAVAIMSGVLQGLHAAHEARSERGDALNIVHRDVSPQNILVGADGVPRVLDFGVAKAIGRVQSSREGQIKGKLAYMAPEQISAGPVSRQTDIFAASVVLWELLAGRRLFRGQNEGDTLYNVLQAVVDPPSKHARGISAAMDEVVLRGLERDRSKRYGTAREMAVDLEKVATIVSAREVGEWVERVAGDKLVQRAAQLANIEMLPTDGLRLSSRPPRDKPLEPSSRPTVRPGESKPLASSEGARSGSSEESSSRPAWDIDEGFSRTLRRARLAVKRHPFVVVSGAVATLAFAVAAFLLLSTSEPLPLSEAGRPTPISLESKANRDAPAARAPRAVPTEPTGAAAGVPYKSMGQLASSASPAPSSSAAARRRNPTRPQSSTSKGPARSIYSRE